jgi:hypothetical protein
MAGLALVCPIVVKDLQRNLRSLASSSYMVPKIDQTTEGFMTEMSIIVPCAGKGTRLALPYPKEIHRVSQSKSLIDFSLAHIEQDRDLAAQIVTVLAPGKESVFDYVSGRMTGICSATSVYFNPEYHEWPGSILSAENQFLERNVALLPDSVLKTVPRQTLLTQFAEAFDRGADLVFAYVAEQDRDRLRALGALRVQGHHVEEFCDKPTLENPSTFNGFWASFGFTKACSAEVLNFMMRSVDRQSVDIAELGLNVQAFAVESYMDLGTWPNMASFLNTENVLA